MDLLIIVGAALLTLVVLGVIIWVLSELFDLAGWIRRSFDWDIERLKKRRKDNPPQI